MINNNMANIQVNKNNINDKENQLSTQKKINKPSDDPVVAIRALRLRSSLDQIDQYLTKNIADASSWLDTTDGALSEANSVLTDLYNYCVQGANDSYSSSERKTLTETLDKLKTAYYSEGDVDYAGRFLFTGYMTDTPLTYQSDEDASPADFTITQQLTRGNLETKKAYTNIYTNQDILNHLNS
jgi:flagellar hook-associated protein 3 FlgL